MCLRFNAEKFTNKKNIPIDSQFFTSRENKGGNKSNRKQNAPLPYSIFNIFIHLKLASHQRSRSFATRFFRLRPIPPTSPFPNPPLFPKFNSNVCILSWRYKFNDTSTLYLPRWRIKKHQEKIDESRNRYCIRVVCPRQISLFFVHWKFQLHLSIQRERERERVRERERERRNAPSDAPLPILRSKLSSFRSRVISSRSCSSKTNRITGSRIEMRIIMILRESQDG